jgi:hypothetical protein
MRFVTDNSGSKDSSRPIALRHRVILLFDAGFPVSMISQTTGSNSGGRNLDYLQGEIMSFHDIIVLSNHTLLSSTPSVWNYPGCPPRSCALELRESVCTLGPAMMIPLFCHPIHEPSPAELKNLMAVPGLFPVLSANQKPVIY